MIATTTTAPKPAHAALAHEFLTSIASTYEKRWKRFQFLLDKHQLLDNVDAEDVFSDTLLKCEDRIKRAGMPSGNAFSTYFDKAVENNLLQYLTKNSRAGNKMLGVTDQATVYQCYDNEDEWVDNTWGDIPTEELPEFDEMGLLTERQQYEALVTRCFSELPQKYQDVLTLVADGMRYREIRRVLDLTKDQVKMRILTARRLMKEKVQLALSPETPADYLDLDEDGSYC